MLTRRLLTPTLGALIVAFHVHAASGATITFSGSVDASGLSGTLLFTIPGIDLPIYAYDALDNGTSTATSISGFSSLSGVTPSDLTTSFGDLERIATTFTPGGCSPTPPPGATNCSTATNHYGEGDASPNFFSVTLAGTGTILTGVFLSSSVTTDTDPLSPGFGTAGAVASVQVTGGISPFLDEALLLTGGSGIADLSLSTFNPVCPTLGTDPCGFTFSGSLSFVPEPSTGLLVAAGLFGFGDARRRTRRVSLRR